MLTIAFGIILAILLLLLMPAVIGLLAVPAIIGGMIWLIIHYDLSLYAGPGLVAFCIVGYLFKFAVDRHHRLHPPPPPRKRDDYYGWE